MDTEETTPSPGVEPGSALAGDPEATKRKRSWPSIVGMGLVIVVVIGVLAGFVVRVDYTTISPGEAKPLGPVVTITGAPTYTENKGGDILFLFVREAYHVNFWQYVRARLDSQIDLAPDNAVNPDNLTPQQQNDQGLQQMADAKNAATAVALKALGYKVPSTPILVVTSLFVNLPAFKVVHLGDVIVSADDHAITSTADLSAVVAKHNVGEDVSLVVNRLGKQMTLSVGVVNDHDDATGKDRKVIGVGVQESARYSFPVKVAVDTTGVGGPSAGLAMTLAIFDALTPGDLTGGLRVAVTGTIDAAGNVGEIGGIEQKAISARAAHVSVFIVPQCSPGDTPAGLASCKADLVRVAQRAGSKIKIVPVSTFAEALKALRDNGGDPAPVVSSTTSTTTKVAA